MLISLACRVAAFHDETNEELTMNTSANSRQNETDRSVADRYGEENAEVITAVLAFSKSVFRRKDEALMIDADERAIYFVRTGSIEVSYTDGNTRIVVAFIGSGHFFGEIGYFDGGSRVRDIRATEDAEICVLTREVLIGLLDDKPVLYGKFMTLMAEGLCAKFRRVLGERKPLSDYAESLSTGSHKYEELKAVPEDFLKTPEGNRIVETVEDYKNRFFKLSYRLQKEPGDSIPEHLEKQGLDLMDELNFYLIGFDHSDLDQESKNVVFRYAFREIFPYVMRSRFAERAYFKPKGYAGDFMMIEMIYGNNPDGDGKLGRIIDKWCLASIPAMAVRGRRQLLADQLEKISDAKISGGGPINIMNLACGPNRELFDFIGRCNYSNAIEALCIDIDAEALQFTNQKTNTFTHGAAVRMMSENLIKWALNKTDQDFGKQDIIYSSGLTDYLDRDLFLALINKCYDHLKPEGVLIVGNFAPSNSGRSFMDHVLHWKLIYRDQNDLKDIFYDSPFGNNVEVMSEEQQINLFAMAVK